MSVDPDLRVALGFMLLLRCAVAYAYAGALSEVGIFAAIRRNPARRIWTERVVWILLTLPVLAFVWNANSIWLIAYAVSPTSADFMILSLPDGLRWLLLIPATIGLLLQIWSRSAACPAQCGQRNGASHRSFDLGAHISPAASAVPLTKPNCPESVECVDAALDGSERWLNGPYQIVRFPFWTADLILFGALLAATDSWIGVIAFCCACVLLRWVSLPCAEEAWRSLLGDDYNEYRSNTGVLLPRGPQLSSGSAPQYFVPTQFGLPAIIALVTMFAVMFGILNAFQKWLTELHVSPILHLYFGLLLMLVWVAQMRFGRSARVASLIVGALLLPVFVAFSLDRWPPPTMVAVSAVGLVMLGGLIGYCMGAMAAGLFLIADWMGPYLPWSRKREATANSMARNHGSPFDESL